MKNNNKKIIIALFFSAIMLAGAFAVMTSGNSNNTALPVNNSPATANSNTLTLYNNATVPTSNPYIAPVNISSSDLSGALSNYTNVYFEYSNGTVITSWLYEYSSAYADWYLRLNQINAGSSITINIQISSGFILNGVSIGEAPQLSSTYAQYDNGVNVFGQGAYYNFKTFNSTYMWDNKGDYYSTGSGLVVDSEGFYNNVMINTTMSNNNYYVLTNFYNTNVSSSMGDVLSYSDVYLQGEVGIAGNGNGVESILYYNGASNVITTNIPLSTTNYNTFTFGTYGNNDFYADGYNVTNISTEYPFYSTTYNAIKITTDGNTAYMHYIAFIPYKNTDITYKVMDNNIVANNYKLYNYSLPDYLPLTSQNDGYSQKPVLIENNIYNGFAYLNATDLLVYNVSNSKLVNLGSYHYVKQFSDVFNLVYTQSNQSIIYVWGINNAGYSWVTFYNLSTGFKIEFNTTIDFGNDTTAYSFIYTNNEMLLFSGNNDTVVIYKISSTGVSISTASIGYAFTGQNVYLIPNTDIIIGLDDSTNSYIGTFDSSTNSFSSFTELYDSEPANASGVTYSSDGIYYNSNEFAINFYHGKGGERHSYINLYTYTGTFIKSIFVGSSAMNTQNGRTAYIKNNMIYLNSVGIGYGLNGVTDTNYITYALNLSNSEMTSIYISPLTLGSTSDNFGVVGTLGKQYASNNGYWEFTNPNNPAMLYFAVSGTGFINYIEPVNDNAGIYSPTKPIAPAMKYNVTILESGLPANTSWSFTFNGNAETLTNTSYKFSVTNGSYAMSVNSVSGYTVSYNNPVTVNGANVTENVVFASLNKIITSNNTKYYIDITINNPHKVFYTVILNENGNITTYNLSSDLIVIHTNSTNYPLSIQFENFKTGYTISIPEMSYDNAGNYTLTENIIDNNDNINYKINQYMPVIAVVLIFMGFMIAGAVAVKRR